MKVKGAGTYVPISGKPVYTEGGEIYWCGVSFIAHCSVHLIGEKKRGQERRGQERTREERRGQERRGEEWTREERRGQERRGEDKRGEERGIEFVSGHS